MKTYCSEEMVGYPEIVEWVPADVARELLEALNDALMFEIQGMGLTEKCEKAIKHACGDQPLNAITEPVKRPDSSNMTEWDKDINSFIAILLQVQKAGIPSHQRGQLENMRKRLTDYLKYRGTKVSARSRDYAELQNKYIDLLDKYNKLVDGNSCGES